MTPCYSCFWGQDSTNIPSPMSKEEWCWVQSSLPDSCIIPVLLDVGFIWELITLWQARISMEGHKVSWFWWPAKALFTDMVDLFFKALAACTRLWQRKNNTLVMRAHLEVWIDTPSAVPNDSLWLRPVSPDASANNASVASAIFEARLYHWRGSRGLDSHTLTDKQLHRQMQT